MRAVGVTDMVSEQMLPKGFYLHIGLWGNALSCPWGLIRKHRLLGEMSVGLPIDVTNLAVKGCYGSLRME